MNTHFQPDEILSLYRIFKPYYLQAHRHYHDSTHIAGMLCAAARIETGCTVKQSYGADSHTELSRHVILAIFAHDIIYVPGAPGDMNEEMSARMLESLYKAGILPAVVPADISEAQRLIRITAKHFDRPKKLSYDEALILDADLSSMSDPNYANFDAQQSRVASEHTLDLTPQVLLKGYEFIKNNLLDKGPIYIKDPALFTSSQIVMLTEWEREARSNFDRYEKQLKEACNEPAA
jgi:predicted metal-dependent HD superfamily phosphohydrolase